jgi:hypothetical protein
MRSVIRVGIAGLALVLCLRHGATQDVHYPNDLTLAKLTKFGAIPPPAVTSLGDLSAYQRNLSTHQVLTLQWDSLREREGIVSREEADRSSADPGTFTLLKQLHGQGGTPGFIDSALASERLVIIGLTKSGELRCATTIENPRNIRSEDFRVNPPQRHDSVEAKTTFDIRFCDDPAIATLSIATRDNSDTSDGMLKLLGAVAIPHKTLPVDH